ncbi:Integrin alpha beta-propellor repeat-containing protein [Hydrogenophaga intermedia]|uniref:Integrin alpha beta-propellor repeat-containing protein n=1 Tax=Hydrogenophaga intermedia TaxID=65786 RepID=A0A1L1PV88_HYDIT|nr:Integrin alpha beta-propellor repeat-containing protein [Hydrogenophaga intermedia]
MSPTAIKTLRFNWADGPGETEYRLLENPDGTSGYIQVAALPADTTQHDLEVFLPERLNASYILQACNSAGCADSAAVHVAGQVAPAIGYVKASNTDQGDRFGTSLALSADGQTLAIGAPSERSASTNPLDNNGSDNGAVYLFTRSGDAWQQRAYIKASNTDQGDRFGTSLALSADGQTLAIGADSEDSASTNPLDNSGWDNGAVYVFTHSGDAWQQQAYLKASNTDQSDRFGTSLALSADGQTLAIGAPRERSTSTNPLDDSGWDNGAVYLFTRSGDAWQQQAYLKASVPDQNDRFGASLALSADGQTLAIGADGDDGASTDPLDDSGSGNGAVYVFTRSGVAWQQQAYLKASVTDQHDRFGTSLTLSADGQTLAIGADGENSANTDPLDNRGSDNGAVYIFTRSGEAWQQRAYLKASVTDQHDRFGTSLALSADGQTLAIGADGENSASTDPLDNSGPESGAVYVFTRSGEAWQQQAYLKASVIDQNDRFGISLALSADGQTLAIGADQESSAATGIGGNPSDNSKSASGAVYLF